MFMYMTRLIERPASSASSRDPPHNAKAIDIPKNVNKNEALRQASAKRRTSIPIRSRRKGPRNESQLRNVLKIEIAPVMLRQRGRSLGTCLAQPLQARPVSMGIAKLSVIDAT